MPILVLLPIMCVCEKLQCSEHELWLSLVKSISRAG